MSATKAKEIPTDNFQLRRLTIGPDYRGRLPVFHHFSEASGRRDVDSTEEPHIVRSAKADPTPDYFRVRCDLSDLGIDVSDNLFRDPINPAVFDGRCTIFSGRNYHVGDRADSGSSEINLG